MILQYWRKSKPIPKGWKVVDDLSDTHHGIYAYIIARVA